MSCDGETLNDADVNKAGAGSSLPPEETRAARPRSS